MSTGAAESTALPTPSAPNPAAPVAAPAAPKPTKEEMAMMMDACDRIGDMCSGFVVMIYEHQAQTRNDERWRMSYEENQKTSAAFSQYVLHRGEFLAKWMPEILLGGALVTPVLMRMRLDDADRVDFKKPELEPKPEEKPEPKPKAKREPKAKKVKEAA